MRGRKGRGIGVTAGKQAALSRPHHAGAGQRIVCALAAALMAAGSVAIAATAAYAQDRALAPLQANPNQPLLLQADELVYDNDNRRVVARGNVEIYYQNYTLLADQVIYDQGRNLLSAEGDVRIKEPDGAVVRAEKITLTDDFRQGFIDSLRVVTQEDARIAAAMATRLDEDTIVFDRAVYTACKPCETDPSKPPTWRIKAAKVIHKKAEGNIYYEDAMLELAGVPIAYVPYFSHPDPTTKRRSGFLRPTFRYSEDLGFGVEVPYYFALAPDYDLLLNPEYMTEQGVLFKAEWRQKVGSGGYNIKVAAIDQIEDTDPNFQKSGFRGTLETHGDFSLGSYWRAGWDVTFESDDSFRKFYKIDSVLSSDRVSQVYVVGLSERSYFAARSYHFGGLSFDDNASAESIVHPVIDHNYVFADPILGGELRFDANVLSLSRDDGDPLTDVDGADVNRLSVEMRWRRGFVDGAGQMITPFVLARGDVYQFSDYVNPITAQTEDRSETRASVAGGVEYRYPFVTHTASAAHVLEPIAQVIARPDTTDQTVLPNEDARSLVFDDTLLFDLDKFSGYDRIETGVRANVGMQYTAQFHSGGYLRAVLGQSFQVSGDNAFDDPNDQTLSGRSGLEEGASDYVAGIYIEPVSSFGVIAQSRLDENFELRRQDIAVRAAYGPFAGTMSYARVRDFEDANGGLALGTLEEVFASASLKITDYWSLFGSIRYDLQGTNDNTPYIVQDSLGVRYSDDCFVLAVGYSESFVDSADVDPDRTLFLRFELRTLGGYNVATGVGDDFSPVSEAVK